MVNVIEYILENECTQLSILTNKLQYNRKFTNQLKALQRTLLVSFPQCNFTILPQQI